MVEPDASGPAPGPDDPPVALRVVPADDPCLPELMEWIAPGAAAELDLLSARGGPDLPPAGQAVLVQVQRQDRTCGACLAWIRPDRTADALPPRVEGSCGRSVVTRLWAGLGDELRQRGVLLLSVALPTEQQELAAWLVQAGCRRTHDLLILAAHTLEAAPTGLPPDWQIVPYDRRQRSRLRRILAATFVGSRDFPELEAGASVDDVLARFLHSGTSEDRLWHLVAHRGEWAGCVLLADQPSWDRCLLVYLGLAPWARGRGGGLLMARFARRHTHHIGRSELVLGVDAENDPAVAVYAASGYFQTARRAILFQRLTAQAVP